MPLDHVCIHVGDNVLWALLQILLVSRKDSCISNLCGKPCNPLHHGSYYMDDSLMMCMLMGTCGNTNWPSSLPFIDDAVNVTQEQLHLKPYRVMLCSAMKGLLQ